MSHHSGASGASSRGPNTILVDLDFSIVELTGLAEGDTGAYQCRWKRGHGHHGETPWVRAEGGRVRWKEAFSLPQQVIPTSASEAAKKKFLDIQLHRGSPNGGPAAHRNLRVELAYQGEKRRKAKIAVPFEAPDGRPISCDLQITVQMRESGGPGDTSSTGNSTGTPSRGRSRDPPSSLRRSQSLSSPTQPDASDAGSTGADPELQTLYAGIQAGTGASADNMKANVLKLFAKIQDQERLLVEKKRECKEIRAAYGTLRTDYDHLRADLESAEQRCSRLKQELRREQERTRDLLELKGRYETQRQGLGDDRRTCEAGNCGLQ